MAAVAEKQAKSAQPQRRAMTRSIVAWSRAPVAAPQHNALREIVAVPQVQKACAGCSSDEIRIERLAIEAGEEEEREERVQRENEAPAFAAGAAAEDEDERRKRRSVPAPRPGAPIRVGAADDEHEREADAVAE